MDAQARDPKGHLHQVRSIRQRLEHGQHVRSSAAVAAKARQVAGNGGELDPQAALRDGPGEIAHHPHHTGVAWPLEQHSVARLEQGKQSVFELIGIADRYYAALGPSSLIALCGALQGAITDQKEMAEPALSCMHPHLAVLRLCLGSKLAHTG